MIHDIQWSWALGSHGMTKRREACLSWMYSSVFHLAASIRFWERMSFTYRYSEAVNVQGTRNTLQALQDLPGSESEKIFVYCSSAAVQLAMPLHMRLGSNFKGYASTFTISDDRPIPLQEAATHAYPQSKAAADLAVRQAHGHNCLRTGVVRSDGSNV